MHLFLQDQTPGSMGTSETRLLTVRTATASLYAFRVHPAARWIGDSQSVLKQGGQMNFSQQFRCNTEFSRRACILSTLMVLTFFASGCATGNAKTSGVTLEDTLSSTYARDPAMANVAAGEGETSRGGPNLGPEKKSEGSATSQDSK